MLLENESNGKTINILFVDGEQIAKRVIDCLLSVYLTQDNYVNPKMLDENFLVGEIRRDYIKSFIGITEKGDVAVTLSAKKNRYFEKSLEIFALAVEDEYRGFKLGEVITQHVLSECKKEGVPSFFAHIVMLHSQASMIYEKNGFIPTGFLFNVCDAQKHLRQLDLVSEKHSWAIYVKNNGECIVGTLYVPKHLKGFVQKIYKALEVNPVLESTGKISDGLSCVEYEQDDYHKILCFYIFKCGNGLLEQLKIIEKGYTDKIQTYVSFLSINDSSAIHGFNILRKLGYSFSGIKPLCGNHEFIIMSKDNGVVFDDTELKMTPALASLYERTREIN